MAAVRKWHQRSCVGGLEDLLGGYLFLSTVLGISFDQSLQLIQL